MSTYVRPAIDWPVFRDAEGAVIPYGNRYWPDPPPDDAYSVVSHPERFKPLHSVADGLITYLRATYDIVADDGPSAATEPAFEPFDVERAVKLTPVGGQGAPLSIAFTSLPGIVLRAGVLYEEWLPDCGCDACDDNVLALVEQLEQLTLAVAEGRFFERLGRGRRATYTGGTTDAAGGLDQSRGTSTNLTRAQRRAARAVLRAHPQGWGPWPRR